MGRTEGSLLVTMLEILKLGGHKDYVRVSSSELGGVLGVSQQTTSNRLVRLEAEKLVERRRLGKSLGVRLTQRGVDQLAAMHAELKKYFGGGAGTLTFNGKVFTGLREGAYYISHPGYRRQLVSLLGFDPFPGTLNLRLSGGDIDKKRELRLSDGMLVEGFERGLRTFGRAKAFRARVQGHQAAALAIDRTHYDDTVLELISPENLRRSLKLKDGDSLDVEVMLTEEDSGS